jgi:hypothetical protein
MLFSAVSDIQYLYSVPNSNSSSKCCSTLKTVAALACPLWVLTAAAVVAAAGVAVAVAVVQAVVGLQHGQGQQEQQLAGLLLVRLALGLAAGVGLQS